MKTPSRWGRRLLRSSRLRQLLCWVIHLYIRVVYATNRWSVEGAEAPRRLRQEGRGFILAFWHGRLLMIPMAWQRLAPMHMLISAHRDGRIIADAVTYFGVQSIPGSTRRGGSAALRTMVKRLEAGDCVGITPDGPRGPRFKFKAGAIFTAQISGKAVVPIAYAAKPAWVLRTWDKFIIPSPFAKVVIAIGEPYSPAKKLDDQQMEAAQRELERRMLQTYRDAAAALTAKR